MVRLRAAGRTNVTAGNTPAFNLFDTHLHLDARGAAMRIDDTPAFWSALMRGDPGRADAARVAREPGYLVSAFRMTADSDHWEMHPNGDEIIHLLSGAVDFILDEPDGARTVALRDRAACIVPRGVWHRTVVRRPGEIVFITFGIGTTHKPVASEGERS
jgi:mannose-6-phosphate isomerase-like protein (cupin superfamily)